MAKEKSQQANFEEVAEKIQSMLATMNYGSITIVVQDGKVIQLERNEKVRIK
ncbi:MULTISPECIES: YezD family protein [Rossellomorea]|uniref:YezD family protein n=1 Tax=Rossellomorea TaxID=2837508 RepID=UPI001CFEDCF7|nr:MULTISPECIES: YezD family protein [Rossellomorea]MDX8344380.1 YezD family protein [Rossellomorea sp. YZS02]